VRIVLVLLLAGCPSGPVGKPEPVASPRECERMADHLVEVMLDGVRERNPDAGASKGQRDTADAINQLFVRLCVDDKWSIEAQKCFGGVAKLDETGKCATYLTVPQREAADKKMGEMFGQPPPAPPP
jgi:hypothetical protein